ncbi:MAG: hypothetical protein NZ866_02845 [Patescibacteria group bacterium]|nr:hypothetical protein [Patescibacteria group bacterium]
MSYFLKKFIISIFLFIFICALIFFFTDYLSQKIFNLSQEINNLIIEKETRWQNIIQAEKIKGLLINLEKKYNLNFKDFKNNYFLTTSEALNQIYNFASTNKINLTTSSENKIILEDKKENLINLINFIKRNKIKIEYLKGENRENRFWVEIKIQ